MGVELRGFEGKVALVTGAARGMGASHARGLAEAGCSVAVVDITEDIPGTYPLGTAEGLEQTVAEINDLDQRAVGIKCDLRDEQAVAAAVEEATSELGPIDILVNNAGVANVGAVHEIDPVAVETMIDCNLKSAIWAIRHVVPGMISRKTGRIVNISSGATGVGLAQLSAYTASKHGVIGLTESLATELAEFGINVNCISPGTIRPTDARGAGMVPGLSAIMGVEPHEAYAGWTQPYNFPGEKFSSVEMQDITDAVLFLASENARIISGINLYVDAGMSTA